MRERGVPTNGQTGRNIETAEYIETIPFTETRNYIQVVLRNAHVYRRLYAANER